VELRDPLGPLAEAGMSILTPGGGVLPSLGSWPGLLSGHFEGPSSSIFTLVRVRSGTRLRAGTRLGAGNRLGACRSETGAIQESEACKIRGYMWPGN